MRLLIMGAPGAGKGTQGIVLATLLGVPHISTGDILRAHVTGHTDLGREAQRFMDAGRYVPDEITNAMVGDRLTLPDASAGFVLDGYPRTIAQVHALDQVLVRAWNELDGVLELAVEVDELVRRLLARAQTGGRADDTEDVIRRRLAIYDQETAPLVDLYTQRGLVSKIDGEGTEADVSARLLSAVQLTTSRAGIEPG